MKIKQNVNFFFVIISMLVLASCGVRPGGGGTLSAPSNTKQSSNLCTALPELPTPKNYSRVNFVNKTNIVTDDQIYLYIASKDFQIHYNPDTNQGELAQIQSGSISTNAFKVNSLRCSADGLSHYIFIPSIESGRINISLTGNAFNYSEADIQDKVEFNLKRNNLVVNYTGVDYYSLPIFINVEGHGVSGMNTPRNQVVTDLKNTFNSSNTEKNIWNSLIRWYETPNQTNRTLTKIIAPGKVADSGNGGVKFDFTTQKQNIAQYFSQKGSGLLSLGYTGKYQDGVFVFTNDKNDIGLQFRLDDLDMSTLLGAAPIPNAIGSKVADLSKAFYSGFEVGLLTPENGPPELINLDDLHSQSHDFYQHNFIDLYSKVLHSYDMPGYSFAYDDFLGQDGTLGTDTADNNPLTITIGDMSGTKIPDPFHDDVSDNYTFKKFSIGGKPNIFTINGKDVNTIEFPFSSKLPLNVNINGCEFNLTFPKIEDGNNQVNRISYANVPLDGTVITTKDPNSNIIDSIAFGASYPKCK